MTSKTVLITGAANGLGRALTDFYLGKDWQVIATDIDTDRLEDLKKNEKAWILRMDVTSDASVERASELIGQEGITIDLIINNAGIDRYFPFSEAPAEKFKEVFEVNLFGSYRVNQILLPLLRKPGGRIIHIGSESLNLTIPFMPYPISKNALERYAKVLRQELRFQGIDVIVIRPGPIRTRLLEDVLNLGSAERSWLLAPQLKNFAQNARKNIGNILEPEKVAAFVFGVAQKSNPKAVYKINNSFQLKIGALLPFSLLERFVRKRLLG